MRMFLPLNKNSGLRKFGVLRQRSALLSQEKTQSSIVIEDYAFSQANN
jgi:hypothetical protein